MPWMAGWGGRHVPGGVGPGTFLFVAANARAQRTFVASAQSPARATGATAAYREPTPAPVCPHMHRRARPPVCRVRLNPRARHRRRRRPPRAHTSARVPTPAPPCHDLRKKKPDTRLTSPATPNTVPAPVPSASPGFGQLKKKPYSTVTRSTKYTKYVIHHAGRKTQHGATVQEVGHHDIFCRLWIQAWANFCIRF